MFTSRWDAPCQNYKSDHTPAKEILFRVNADSLKRHIFIKHRTLFTIRFIPTPLQVKIRLDIVGTVYNLVIHMQSNKIHEVFQ